MTSKVVQKIKREEMEAIAEGIAGFFFEFWKNNRAEISKDGEAVASSKMSFLEDTQTAR